MVTVFTPTYNRCELLGRLYDSLLKQTVKDFEWIIVDDGSSDNTKNIVEKWISKNLIRMKYIYQENQGKYIAFNTGIDNAKGDLFFCVDSDDYIPENTVENIIKTWDEYRSENISGIIALKSDIKGNPLGTEMPYGVIYSTAYDLVTKYKSGGERALIYRTDILKKNKYPVIEREKFVTECVLYDRIDMQYSMILLNKVLTVCEYQPDGLTNSLYSIMLANPTGYKLYYSQRIEMAKSVSDRIGYIIRYNAFKTLSSDNKYNYKGKHNIQVAVLTPLGWLAAKYYKTRSSSKDSGRYEEA